MRNCPTCFKLSMHGCIVYSVCSYLYVILVQLFSKWTKFSFHPAMFLALNSFFVDCVIAEV